MLRMLKLCSVMLTLGSGKSGSCSRLETKTELAKMRLESDFRGRVKQSSSMYPDLVNQGELADDSLQCGGMEKMEIFVILEKNINLFCAVFHNAREAGYLRTQGSDSPINLFYLRRKSN
jgi:hypothetical protein